VRWGTRAVFGRRVGGSSGNRCVTRQPTHWLLDARLRGHDSLWQWAARHCEVIDYWMPDCAGMTAWGGVPRDIEVQSRDIGVMGHWMPACAGMSGLRFLRGSLRERLTMTAGFAAVAAGVCCASFEARLREHLRMTVRYEGQEERAHPSRLATRASHDDDVLELWPSRRSRASQPDVDGRDEPGHDEA
jgi:hypothetical protein